MNARELLVAVNELLCDEGKWTKGAFARDAGGLSCDVDKGCCWCVDGALIHVGGGCRYTIFQEIRDVLYETSCGRGLISYNDAPETTFADIKAWLHRACEAASSQRGV